MITEDQIVDLYAKSNPVPRLDHLDPVESLDTVNLTGGMSFRGRGRDGSRD